MRVLEGGNNVKVYNLSAGKSLPDWLTAKKRRKLIKRDVDFQHRIELIQDFEMPDVSNRIKISPDGQYIMATGTYKPRVRCYEVAALSQKFERCFDADIIDFEVLSEDYSKLVFLQDERFLEFHNQGGRWFRARIPKFGRDMAYHFPSCDLYVAAAGNEVYRLNLNQGRFLSPLELDCYGINKCVFNPMHYLLACGTEDGRVEAWDPRSRKRAGLLDCSMHMALEDIPLPQYKTRKHLGVTSLAFDGNLMLGVGMYTGQVLLYDIRSDKPMLIKDHADDLPINDLEFHSTSGMVLSLSVNTLKIWEKETGKHHTSIESESNFNDLCTIPDSGMIFLAQEHPKMQIYFLPSLGPAPKWCGHLDALIEELEEEDISQTFDDYKFITEEELKILGLDELIGTNVLRAVMHGYYIDVRLYNKAKTIANPFNYQEFIKKKVKQKIAEQTERKTVTKNLPKVNQEIFNRLVEDKEKGSAKQVYSAKSLLKDERFQPMFVDEDFTIDKETDAFRLLQPAMQRNSRRKQKEKEESDDDEEFLRNKAFADPDSSDSDSIFSGEEDKDSTDSEVISDNDANRKKVVEPRHKEFRKGKRRKEFVLPSNAKPLPSSDLVSADTEAELRQNRRKLSRMSLASRLAMDDDEDENAAFGSREVTFVPRATEKESLRFEKRREEQMSHRAERKAVVRSSRGKIGGKIRMNKPFT